MDKFRRIAILYNVINITSIVSLISIFFFQIYYISFVWYIVLDDETLYVLLFWPFLLLIAIVQLNKFFVRNKIHKELEYHYEANNINWDNKKDRGSLSTLEKGFLPKYYHKKRSWGNANFDLKFWGEIEDLGISYKIDEFEYYYKKKVGYGNNEKTVTLFNFKGNAAIFEYKNIILTNSPIIVLNKKMDIESKDGMFTLPEKLPVNGHIIRYMNVTDIDKQKVIDLINSYPEFFSKKCKIFLILDKNKLIILTDEKHKFKIRIPLLITKGTIEKLLGNQKGNIYRFNMVLNKVATIFYN